MSPPRRGRQLPLQIGLCSRFLKQSPDEASEKGTGHGGWVLRSTRVAAGHGAGCPGKGQHSGGGRIHGTGQHRDSLLWGWTKGRTVSGASPPRHLPQKKELSEAAPQDAGPEDTTEDGVGGPQREVGHGDRRGTARGWETTLWCASSDSGTRDCSLTEKVCQGPEGESQSFLSTPTWPVSTQSGGGCRGATTVSPRVSRGCRRQPGRSAGSLAQRHGLSVPRTVWPLQSSCPKAASPRAFPNSAVSSSDLDPVCALETCLDPEPRTCSGCSSRDGENLQVSDV